MTCRSLLDCAHAEAKGVHNGISLVKLMGRYSGSIAAGATLASQEVNFTLVPEVLLRTPGDFGSLSELTHQMEKDREQYIEYKRRKENARASQ